jgi:hypothetical protein
MDENAYEAPQFETKRKLRQDRLAWLHVPLVVCVICCWSVGGYYAKFLRDPETAVYWIVAGTFALVLNVPIGAWREVRMRASSESAQAQSGLSPVKRG